MSGSLKYSIPALTSLTDKVIAHKAENGSVDHLLILADALTELATEQHHSGLTVSAKQTRVEAVRLRETANTRTKPAEIAQPEAAHDN